MSIPSLVAPSSRTWLGLGREAATGTPVLPAWTVPLDKSSFEPADDPKFLEDLAIRGSMSHRFQDILGPEDSTFSYGGPFYGDMYGLWLDNVFGDLSTTGTSPASATTTTATTSVGATSVTAASASGYLSGSIVQIDSGPIAEVVVLSGAPSGSTLNFSANPLRFAHTSGATVAIVQAPFTHVFAVLNQVGSVGGVQGAQPPAHTGTDYTGLTPGVGARAYPSLCVSQMDITGNTEGLLMAKVTGTGWPSAPAASSPAATTSFTAPLPFWRTTVSINNSPVPWGAEFSFALKRELGVEWTAQGSQSPYIIARGDLDVTGSYKQSVASDETVLNYMLNNNQYSLSVSTTNGLSGAAEISLTISTTHADVVKAKPVRSGVVVGYDADWRGHANATDVGGSGGLGEVTCTLINAVPTY